MRTPKPIRQPWPIPASWRWAAIGEIATAKNGDVSRLEPANFPGCELHWVRASDLRDNFVFSTSDCIDQPSLVTSGATLFPKGTVCIARYGSGAGRLGILQTPAVANSAICGILPSNRLWPEFLFHFLQFERGKLASRKSCPNQSYITLSALRAAPIPVAPIDQQRHVSAAIASRLAQLDSRWRQLNRILSNLRRNRSDTFASALNRYLVRGEWFHMQAESRAKPLAGSLPSRIFENANRGKSSSRIPPLPQGWTLKSAQQACSEITYGWDVQPAYEMTGYRLVTLKGISDGFINFPGCGFISDALFERHKRHCSPRKNDILLIGGGQYIGVSAMVESDTPFAIGRHILLMRPLIYPRYLSQWLRSGECQRWIQKRSGLARRHLRLSEIRRMPVLVPSMDEQIQIVAEVDRHISLINHLDAAILRLQKRAESLRLDVLSHAFRGTLTTQRNKNNLNRYTRRVGDLPLNANLSGRSLSQAE